MKDEDFDEFMEADWKARSEMILADALRWKFPGIKGVEVSGGKISFDDDGRYTAEEVRRFVEDLKSFKL